MKRSMLHAYALIRLTAKTSACLDECLNYAWPSRNRLTVEAVIPVLLPLGQPAERPEADSCPEQAKVQGG